MIDDFSSVDLIFKFLYRIILIVMKCTVNYDFIYNYMHWFTMKFIYV